MTETSTTDPGPGVVGPPLAPTPAPEEATAGARAALPEHDEPPARPARSLGSLLAVCGLCGGAGASTLAYLVAWNEVHGGRGPLLVCDAGGPSGGLASYAGVESPRSLAGVAAALARDEPLDGGLFAEAEAGLRVVARRPALESEPDEGTIARVLADAREAHSLTVVDCGALARGVEREALSGATHVAWVLPATASGLARARRTLGVLSPEGMPAELVVARSDAAGTPPPTAELAALVAERRAPLVLMPHVPDLAERPAKEAAERATVTLQAITGVLAR